ncbi:MAG: TetR/AcrR family transcriptional regulator, partial [Xanthomonadales bacterium]|nr:TetR/AcrR family transcriptional regulator [Xanthomonadales bacterium]
MAPPNKSQAVATAGGRRSQRKQGPRERLLAAGKQLFSENGYEATSTSSIASQAGTSESQLMRYFGGKAGLLEEIFNVGWVSLNDVIKSQVIAAPTGRDAILAVLETLNHAFHNDEALARIYLFEGRRIRGVEHEVFISEGFLRFRELIHALIQRGLGDGSFEKNLPEAALVSALIGCAEGMIRDQLLARRTGEIADFSAKDIRAVVSAILGG